MTDNSDENPQCEACFIPYGPERSMFCMIVCRHHFCEGCKLEKICRMCETETGEIEFSHVKGMTRKIIRLEKKIEKLDEENCVKKKPRLEQQLKCQSCNSVDFEQNLHLCQTCSIPDFEGNVDFLKLPICSTCALRNHARLGHTTVDFFPCVRDIMFKFQEPKVGAGLKALDEVNEMRKAEMIQLQKTNDAIRKHIIRMFDNTKNSTSTVELNANMEKLQKLTEMSKNINAGEKSLKKKNALLETILVELSDDGKRKRKSN